jgi:hypothetical protein
MMIYWRSRKCFPVKKRQVAGEVIVIHLKLIQTYQTMIFFKQAMMQAIEKKD